MYIMLIEMSCGHEQFFIYSRRAQINAYPFFKKKKTCHSVFTIDLSYCTFLSCHVSRKKYIPVRKCQEAAAIVGTALGKRVHDAPRLCLPLVLSAQLFLFSLFPGYSQQILLILSQKCLP